MSGEPKVVTIPASALVVLIGVAGSGKSTFAKAHFHNTQILSSDFFRALVSDDEGDQEASADAFELLHSALEKRLCRGKLSVVDATNIRPEHRARLLDRARRFGRPAVALVLETPLAISVERATSRIDRSVPPAVVHQQSADLVPQSDEGLLREGFAAVYRFDPAGPPEIRRMPSASPVL